MGKLPSTGSVEPSGQASAMVKGTLIFTLMKFATTRRIDAQTILARLTSEDREVLRSILLPSGWYSAEMFSRLTEAVALLASGGDKAECLKDMGRFSAQTNLGLGGLRRAYIREGDPHHVLGAIPRIYKTVYTKGHRTYERTGECSAIIRAYDAGNCLWAAGWLQRVVELSGGKDVRTVEVQCQASGAPHCEFRLRWMLPSMEGSLA